MQQNWNKSSSSWWALWNIWKQAWTSNQLKSEERNYKHGLECQNCGKTGRNVPARGEQNSNKPSSQHWVPPGRWCAALREGKDMEKGGQTHWGRRAARGEYGNRKGRCLPAPAASTSRRSGGESRIRCLYCLWTTHQIFLMLELAVTWKPVHFIFVYVYHRNNFTVIIKSFAVPLFSMVVKFLQSNVYFDCNTWR